MSLAYPVARSLEEATQPGVKFARSRREAADLSPGENVAGLETSWLHLSEAEAVSLFGAQGADGPAGHVQRYEDTSGHVVVAVSWWKLGEPEKAKKKAKTSPPPQPSAQDHTDDLYFRSGRTKSRRRRPVDPRQLDLFAGRED